MKKQLLLAGVALLLLVGCAKKVMVPPTIDLHLYETIGLVQFSSNAEGALDALATQKFIEALQAAQPGVRILELGDQAEILESVGRDEMDFQAVRAIGEKYGVEVVVVGDVEVTDVKPRVQLLSLSSFGVSADVEVTLAAKLYDGASGATIWTNSCSDKRTVAHVGVSSSGPVDFGAGDPEAAYGELVYALVYTVTRDFRVRYVKG